MNGTTERLSCPLKNAWVSFRLVDEHGKGAPYAGLPYRLHDSQGQAIEGFLDNDGYALIRDVHLGAIVLDLSQPATAFTDPWYEELAIRKAFKLPLTAVQMAAEQSPAGPRRTDGKTYLAQERAVKEDAYFIRAEVSDFVASKGHLPTPDEHWTTPSALKQNAGSAADQPGIALGCNRRHVIEIKALRAYSPLLSRGADFCALNAYHPAVMSAFAYAPFSTATNPYSSAPPPYSAIGSIGHVLQNQLGRRIQPTPIQHRVALSPALRRSAVFETPRNHALRSGALRKRITGGLAKSRRCALLARHR